MKRALLYSHDTFGLGHLRRNLVISETLLQRRPPFDVTLLTGSPVSRTWPMPNNINIREMEPVVKIGAERYASRNTAMTFEEVKIARERLILDAILHVRPDVFLVDHAPSGMKGELLTALAYLRARLPETRVVLGLRDILDDAETVRAHWHNNRVYDLIERYYDRVLVYGQSHFFDVVAEYGLPPKIEQKLTYCGYVARMPTGSAKDLASSDQPFVLVTVGGGGDGYSIISAYLKALNQVAAFPWRSIIVSGPLMPVDQQRALEREVSGRKDVKITRVTTGMSELISSAQLVVAMAGYNTAVEILAAQKPAILIPRAAPRAEQRIRAAKLADGGVVWSVAPEDDDMIVKLAEFLQLAITGARPRALGDALVDLDGARLTADALEKMFSSQTAFSAAGR